MRKRNSLPIIILVALAISPVASLANEYSCGSKQCEDDAGCSGIKVEESGCAIQCYKAGDSPGEIKKGAKATCTGIGGGGIPV